MNKKLESGVIPSLHLIPFTPDINKDNLYINLLEKKENEQKTI
jgi:hypothetical protein